MTPPFLYFYDPDIVGIETAGCSRKVDSLLGDRPYRTTESSYAAQALR